MRFRHISGGGGRAFPTGDNHTVKVIVTGGNSGVGKATATALAAAGHSVVIACRTLPKGREAAADMTGDVEVSHLDLANLASVRRFAESVTDVDVLINNAGVMGLPLTRTADGFEATMGINYLGHFALTCLLGDRITNRVISVTSAMHTLCTMHVDDMNWHTRRYSKWSAYEESKRDPVVHLGVGATRRARLRDGSGRDGYRHRQIRHGTDGLAELAAATPALPSERANGARASIQAVTTTLPSGTYLAPRFNQWGKPKVAKLRRRPSTRSWAADCGRSRRS